MSFSTTTTTAEPVTLTALNSEMWVMDYIWLTYAVIVVIVFLCVVVPGGPLRKWWEYSKHEDMSVEFYSRALDGNISNEEAELALKNDIPIKRRWHNDLNRDFMVYLRNEHSLIGTCFAHDLHPYSRRNRRYILLCTILVDFAVAVMWAYSFSYLAEPSNTIDFIVGEIQGYIFGLFMGVIEGILVKFAICKCKDRSRCCKNNVEKCGRAIITLSLVWSLMAFGISILFIDLVSKQGNSQVFWAKFFLDYFIGMVIAWFLCDLFCGYREFRTEWNEEEIDDDNNTDDKSQEVGKTYYERISCCLGYLFCGWRKILSWLCCCSGNDDDEGIVKVKYSDERHHNNNNEMAANVTLQHEEQEA